MGSRDDAEAGDAPKARTSGPMATVNDVARLAGVSKATVSKALNGRAGVRPETRAQVQAAAAKLGYRPNPQALSLVEGRTGTVGLLTNELEGRFSLPILMGAEDALGAGRLSVFLCDARGDAIREQYHLDALLNRRIDGLIVVGDRAAARPSLGVLPVPVVYASGPSMDEADASVITDDHHAGRIGAEHLLAVGRREIVYVGGDPSYQAATQRSAGAESVLASAGLRWAEPPVYGPWSESWGRQAARALIERGAHVDAIMCGNDQIARGVMDALREAGVAVPREVAVLGHDNWELFTLQARPPLSSIDMNYEEVGRLAAELLVSAMAGDPRPGLHRVLGRVIVRESTLET